VRMMAHWADLNMETGRLVVARQIVSVGYKLVERETKTDAGQDRVVFLDSVVREILTAWAVTRLTERANWGDAYHDDGRDGSSPPRTAARCTRTG